MFAARLILGVLGLHCRRRCFCAVATESAVAHHPPPHATTTSSLAALLGSGRNDRVVDEWERLSEPPRAAFPLALVAYSRLNRSDMLLSTFERLRDLVMGLPEGERVHLQDFTETFRKLRGQPRHTLLLWENLRATSPTLSPSMPMWEFAITAYCNANQVDKALNCFLELQSLVPSVLMADVCQNIFAQLMRACDRSNQPLRALALLSDLQARGFEPDAANCNELLMISLKLGDRARTQNLLLRLRAMVPASEDKKICTYSTLMRYYCEQGDTARVLQLFDSIVDSGHEVPLEAANSALIACAHTGQLETANKIFRLLKTRGPEPNQRSFNAVLRTHMIRAKNPDYAFEVLEQLQSEGLVPNAVTYDILLHTCASLNSPEHSFRVLSLMKARKIAPTAHTYSSLIKQCSRAKLLSKALEIFDEACRTRVANSATYNSILHACATNGELSRALNLFATMRSSSTAPPVDSMTFETIVDGCVAAKDFDKAFLFLAEMQEAGLPPAPQKFAYLIDECGKHGHLDAAEALLANGFRHYPAASGVLCSHMMGAYARNGDFQRASQLFSWIVNHSNSNSNSNSTPPSRKAVREYFRAMIASGRRAVVRQAIGQFMALAQPTHDWSHEVYIHAMRCCTMFDLVPQARALIRQMIERGGSPGTHPTVFIDYLRMCVRKHAIDEARELRCLLDLGGLRLDPKALRLIEKAKLLEQRVEDGRLGEELRKNLQLKKRANIRRLRPQRR